MFEKIFYINLENPFKTMSKLKGVFKPLKCQFSYGRMVFPEMWVCKPSLIQLVTRDVMWKNKFSSPRHEDSPYIWIHLFGYNFLWYWKLPKKMKEYDMDYWEQALWYLYFADSNIEKAKKTWPWADLSNNSTWNENFLV